MIMKIAYAVFTVIVMLLWWHFFKFYRETLLLDDAEKEKGVNGELTLILITAMVTGLIIGWGIIIGLGEINIKIK